MRVPVQEGNRVQRQGLTDAKFVPAQGAGIGEGLESLGRAGVQAADAQDRINAQLDEAGAKTLDPTFVQRVRPTLNDFYAKQGLAAGVAQPDVEKAIKTARDEVLAKASTPRMKHMLGQVLDARIAGELDSIGKHTRTQIGQANDQASLARQGISAEEAIAAREPNVRDQNINTGLNEIASYGASKGWAPEAVKAEQFKWGSGVHFGIARNMVDADDVDGALGYIEDNKDKLSDADSTRLHTMLREPLQRRESNGDVDGLMGAATKAGPAGFSYSDPLHGSGRGVSSAFGERRGSETHNGVDLPAPVGTAIYSTAGGRVAKVARDDRSGLHVVVDHGDGTTSSYSHMGEADVKVGDRVSPDLPLGKVGMTGHTTGPHVHWVVKQDGKAVDPEALVGRVQQSPQRHDLNALFATADRTAAAEGWSPERLDRAKGEIERRASRDEKLLTRQEEDARDKALDVVDGLGDGFTSMSQLPPSLVAGLSPEVRLRLHDQARANIKSNKPKADGDTALALNLMAIQDKATFASTDLRLFRDKMTPGEFASLATLQAKSRTNPDASEMLSHEAIWATINRYAPDLGLDLGASQGKARKPADRAASMRIFSMMQGDLKQLDRKPTDDEVKSAFDRAVMQVKIVEPKSGWFGRDQTTSKRLYEVQGPGTDVPPAVRQRIIASYGRSQGRAPTQGELAETYQRHKGQPGFWQ